MTEQNYVFTKDCRFQQGMTLGLTGFIGLVSITVALCDHKLWIWILSIIVLIVIVATNLLVAKLYKVRKDGQTIVVENIWHRP